MQEQMKELRVIFMGTPEFAVPVLKSLIENTNVILVVSQKDALVGRKKVLTPSPIKRLALDNNIEVFTPDKLKDEYEYILNKKPDIVITCAYGQIVPKQIIDYPEYGCINVHASLLPKYRGASPIVKAIQNGEESTGITIMYMDEHLDTGNIIQAREIPILDDDTFGTLSEKLSLLGAKTLIDTLPSIIECENFDIPQDDEASTYVGLLKREDERIDFNKTRREVYNFIRSLNPTPGANTIILGEEWKLLSSTIGDANKDEVGKIIYANKDGLGIQCKDGIINITSVKRPGKNVVKIKDLLNGFDKNKLIGIKVGEEIEKEEK